MGICLRLQITVEVDIWLFNLWYPDWLIGDPDKGTHLSQERNKGGGKAGVVLRENSRVERGHKGQDGKGPSHFRLAEIWEVRMCIQGREQERQEHVLAWR